MKANYTYLSDGTKAAAYTSASAGKDYVGSFTYTRGGGGRIRKTGTSSYAVDYHITDHLGSVRAIVNASGTIQEQNDYYPFGTRHPNGLTQLSANRWRFSGKEEQDGFGIAYSDFGARLYDRSAAWTAIDPMAEKYYAVSPYVYCHNNPINWIDSDGRADWRLIKQGVIGLGTGIGSAIAGAAITEGTGGVASSIGATMVVDGVVGSLWGTTNILLGFLTSQSEENNKLIEMNLTDATDILAKSGDLMMNNQHHEIEITTNIIKIGIGFGITRGKNAHLIKSLSDVKKALVKLSSFLQIQGAVQTTLEEYLPETIEQTNQDILDAEKELMLKCQSINAFEHE